MVAFYACYALFLVFPVAGPRYSFPEPQGVAKEVLPAVLARLLLERGAAWGTAFPSSHVAAALVATVSAGLAWRGLGLVLLPLAVALSLGTVYGQFHYAVDALAGAFVAALVLALRRPLTRGLSNGLESTW
jgi:membrane-associated phospholipid phosphatase